MNKILLVSIINPRKLIIYYRKILTMFTRVIEIKKMTSLTMLTVNHYLMNENM